MYSNISIIRIFFNKPPLSADENPGFSDVFVFFVTAHIQTLTKIHLLSMQNAEKENLGWIDLLRVLACFLVVVSHSSDPFIGQFGADNSSFLTGMFTGSLVRCCVPLFVMMTGVLLLPVRTGIRPFYRKRIGRIVLPLAFWSVALPLLYYFYLSFGVPTSNPMVDMESHTLGATIPKMWTWILNFNFDTIPLWYLYMLIGLYLAMPIVSAWLEKAEKRDVRLVLCLWGVSLFLPYIKMAAPALGYTGNYGSMEILGACDWNPAGTFYYFSGFLGYTVLAYYLVRYPLQWSWRKTLWICLPMFLAGYAITSGGYLLTNHYFPGDYAKLEVIWNMAGINVFMMTFPVFVIVQKMKIPSSAGLSRLAGLTFGVYLCHFFFVQVAYDLFDFPQIPAIVRLLGMAVVAFGISLALVWLMDRTKLTRRFVK